MVADAPMINLKQIKEPTAPAPTPEAEEEQKDYAKQIEVDRQKAELEGFRQDITERKEYARKIFSMLCLWLVGVFAMLLLQGFLSDTTSPPMIISHGKALYAIRTVFKLSDSVLLAVVGGTTASVISIFIIVANYLFPKR